MSPYILAFLLLYHDFYATLYFPLSGDTDAILGMLCLCRSEKKCYEL